MDLQQNIEEIMNVSLWKFDGLPEPILSKLDALIISYHIEELISSMQLLMPKFKDNEKTTRAYRGNSGIAGEMHMAIKRYPLRVKTLRYI